MATPTMDADEVETFSDCSSTVECICEEFESNSDSEEVVGVLMPYRFEPYLSDVQSDEPNSDSDDEGEAAGDAMADGGELEIDGQIPLDSETRLQNMDWCTCGNCVDHRKVKENVCCREQMRVCERREKEPGIDCITQHHGFPQVCLAVDVLETAYFAYRDHYGLTFGNDWKRYTAYRQFVRWCYEFLGKKNRVTLPSCTVAAIRNHFPSPDYTGFREADD
ncbi:PREDICTED: uncharacterized protein LOC109470073 [Branchiostoma belcheri]|uniref:Uncharacterized protein LOC109470073 n=1 Tax=Branchiostoma belcheri TaxID=7741 RepID=A0A6P4YRT2_BRABE|nr:PREDICTED: uncharacterized protein LOC109470073 [Branchiostoma belcheri]